MNMCSTVYSQYFDFYLYKELDEFIRQWKERDIVDSETASLIHGHIRDELDRRRNQNINEMDRLIKKAFNYTSLTQGDHPEVLLAEMMEGNF